MMMETYIGPRLLLHLIEQDILKIKTPCNQREGANLEGVYGQSIG